MKMRYLKYAIIAVAVGFLYISCAPNFSGDSSPLVGKPANEFSLQTIDGHTVRPSDYKGSVVVLDFWATWCGPCQQSLPNLNRLSNDAGLAKRGLKVLAVNSREPVATVRSFLDQNHYTLAVALDSDGSAEQAYQIDGLPTTVIIGRDGKIKKMFVGFDPDKGEAELLASIHQALAE
jgi:peroxiredoxin